MTSAMQRQPRPSIVIDSTSGSEIDYPGSDVIIHKKDFLIHIKKLSIRSQSSDCATERRVGHGWFRLLRFLFNFNLFLST